MKELALLLSAIRSAVLGEHVELAASPEEWQRACSLAVAHDLGAVALEGFVGCDLPPAAAENLLRRSAAALARFYAQNSAVDRLTAALEEAGIDYMPLKGSVYRALYPNPEWRVGRDVDILVRQADFERARRLAEGLLSPVKIAEGYHDVGLETADGVRLELHFALFNGDEGFGELLCDPFAAAEAHEGHRYVMCGSALYAYHVAHMAKHFYHGGCGIRAFLDLFLLDRTLSREDRGQAEVLLTEAGLLAFAAAVHRQCLIFFTDAPGDADTDRLGRFVASNRAFGSFRSEAAAQATRNRGKKQGFFSRAFPRYGVMCHLYPVLRRWPILLPFCWILRGFRLFSKKDRDRFLSATRASAALGEEDLTELGELYQYLHLKG